MQRRTVWAVAMIIGVLFACGGESTPSVPPATSVPSTTLRPDPTFPTPQTSTSSAAPETTLAAPSTTEPQTSASGCVTTPGALQALIDQTPDGRDVADMKGKLSDAKALGFSVLDISRDCFENQGDISLEGRYGLWIVRPTTFGSDWVLMDMGDTVLSGINLNGGSLHIDGGSQRVEAGEIHDLSVANVTDFMMGKMTVTGHAVFDTLTRNDSDKSFVRNCDFNTVELVGEFDGFKIETSTAASVVNNAEPSSNLNLTDIAIR